MHPPDVQHLLQRRTTTGAADELEVVREWVDNAGPVRAVDYLRDLLDIADLPVEWRAYGYGELAARYCGLSMACKAIQAWERYLAIAEQLEDIGRLVRAHAGLGSCYKQLGRHEDALGYHKRAAQLAAQTHDPDEEAWALSLLANTAIVNGAAAEGLAAATRALAIAQALQSDALQCAALQSMAKCGAGGPEEELRCLTRAFAIARRTPDGWLQVEAALLLAAWHSEAGHAPQAQQLYTAALKASTAHGWANKQVTCLKGLARLSQSLEQARHLLVQGWELARTLQDPWLASEVTSGLRGLYLRLGDHSMAAEVTEEHMELVAGFQDPVSVFESLLSFAGELMEEDGNADAAAKVLRRAVKTAPDDGYRSDAWLRLGQLHCREDECEEAFKCYDAACALAERTGDQMTFVDCLEKKSLLHFYLENTEDSIACLSTAHEILMRTDPLDRERLLENRRSLGVAYLMDGHWALAEEALRSAMEHYNVMNCDLDSRHRVLYNESHVLLFDALEKALLQQGKVSEALLASDERRARVLWRHVARGEGAAEGSSAAESLAVAARIQGTVVFYSCNSVPPEQVHAWVVTCGGCVHHVALDWPASLPRDPATPSNPPEPLGPRLQQRAGRAEPCVEGPSDTLDTDLRAMYDALIRPLEPHLPSPAPGADPAPLLVLIPDGPLWAVPFPALAAPDGTHFIERYALAFAPALRLVPRLQARLPAPAQARADLPAAPLVVGDPATALAPLPHARAEARAVAQALGAGPGAAMLQGPAATPAAVLRALPDCTCLHMACHAADTAAQGPHSLFTGALCLAGEGTSTAHLYSEHLAAVRLTRCRLATLSACSTFRGQTFQEGLLGLPYALLIAGAAAIVTTMWPVADGATRCIMQDFYAALCAPSGPGPDAEAHAVAAALRTALCKAIARGVDVCYWGPFLLYGL